MKDPFSQNKSTLGDSIAQQIPFEGEPQSAEYSNRGFLLLIIAVIIILIGGCFAIAASSSATNPVSAAEKLFYVD